MTYEEEQLTIMEAVGRLGKDYLEALSNTPIEVLDVLVHSLSENQYYLARYINDHKDDEDPEVIEMLRDDWWHTRVMCSAASEAYGTKSDEIETAKRMRR